MHTRFACFRWVKGRNHSAGAANPSTGSYRLCRLDPGRANCRIEAGNPSHGECGADTPEQANDGDGQREVPIDGECHRNPGAEKDSNYSSGGCQDRGFEQELGTDVGTGDAQRTAYSDVLDQYAAQGPGSRCSTNSTSYKARSGVYGTVT